MSINFQQPPSPESIAMMQRMFGEPVAKSDREFLYDKLNTIERKQMSELARAAKQPVSVELHDVGEIKTMSDGTKYRVTPTGWVKVE